MNLLAKEIENSDKTSNTVKNALIAVRRNVLNNLGELVSKDYYLMENSLTKKESKELQRIIYNDIMRLEQVIKDKNAVIERKDTIILDKKEELSSVKNELRDIYKELDIKNKKLVQEEKKCERYRKDIEDIQNSFTFKCGRVITFFPRALRSVIQYIKKKN